MATPADVHELALPTPHELVALTAADAEGLGDSGRGDRDRVDEDLVAAAREIQELKADLRERFPGRDTDDLTDVAIMREVLTTVGRASRLGEHVRCVVIPYTLDGDQRSYLPDFLVRARVADGDTRSRA